jgi:hypothetical protein
MALLSSNVWNQAPGYADGAAGGISHVSLIDPHGIRGGARLPQWPGKSFEY